MIGHFTGMWQVTQVHQNSMYVKYITGFHASQKTEGIHDITQPPPKLRF
jgi:hypothetical protein